ncbi:hypothetical protein [Corynebacterium oculi]|uniref:Uncharacterized protein n=1 Tax=Corynebacterium oculi TaxID=1544416 RepID=A0A0N8VZQ7_9CORY|nr:hypothetical protein [Corynebacterium oculi]KQB84570.1 hypothetical protein Cocul_01378 [Corynebacterium oculi]
MMQKDSSRLNHTRAGRLAQAAFAGAWEALPDYVSSRARRGAIKAALVAGGIAVVSATTRGEGLPEDTPGGMDLSPTQTWAAVAAGLVMLAIMPVLNHKVRVWLTGGLRRFGIRRPYTALGAGVAALVFALLEAEAAEVRR